MWIITDKAMRNLLGGDFKDVVLAKKKDKDIPITTLYNLQEQYLSYQGFRKFFKNHLQSIVEKICFIKDNSIIGNVIKYITGMK